MNALGVAADGHVHLAAVAAVLGGVVQQIQKYLLQPLRVAGDQGYLSRGRGVVDLDTGLLHQLPIGKEGVLQLGGNVDKLNAQIEAPVLNPGKLQHLRHHAREPFRFL